MGWILVFIHSSNCVIVGIWYRVVYSIPFAVYTTRTFFLVGVNSYHNYCADEHVHMYYADCI